MDKPWVFVLGAQKCGTTTVADLLSLQPEVFVPSIKETYYFCDEAIFAAGESAWLDEFYYPSAVGSATVMCDATPFYLASEAAMSRLSAFRGRDAKYIVALRDPVRRAYSAYWHQRRNGFEELDFQDALDAEQGRIAAARQEAGRWWRHAYVEVGKYADQLERAFDMFGRDNVLVLTDRDLRDTAALQSRLRSYLNLPASDVVPTLERSNAAAMPRSRRLHQMVISDSPLKRLAKRLLPRELRTKLGRKVIQSNLNTAPNPPMEQDTWAHLRDVFEADITRLENMGLGDLSAWRADPAPRTETSK